MILHAWRSGWRRVVAAPAIVAGVFAATLLLALPLAWTLRGLIDAHLGRSLMADSAADGVNYDWWQEFMSQTSSLGTTFTPNIIGFAATLDNTSSVLDGVAEIAPVTAVLITYLTVWLFLAGGILDRYARQRRTRAHGFFAACGVFFFRFLRLAIVAGAVYWFLFGYLHPRMFDVWYKDLTFDMDTERSAFVVRAALYAVFGALLVVVNAVFDYAKVRIVVEDRQSVAGGLLAALRFMTRQPGRVAVLWALNAATFGLVLALWAVAAPGAGGSGPPMWVAFGVGQLYVLARLLLKLQFLASETALFQSSLAHAAYTAAPTARWPESPAAESLAPAPPNTPAAL